MNKKRLGWLIVIIGSIGMTTLPFIFYYKTTGFFLPSVLPQLGTDVLFYLGNVKEVLDGHIFLGNPFIKEYADTISPGIILPIWITAIPGLFGIGINATFAINTILYSIIAGILLYVFCLRITQKNIFSAVLAVFGLGYLHELLIRPITLQITGPVLLLFAMALLSVIECPYKKRNYVFLGVLCVFSFYLYPHLWMMVFGTIGLLFLLRILQKDRNALRAMVIMGIGITIACLPQILTIFSIFHDPLAQELSRRVGLVATHSIHPLTVFNLKYSILLVIGLLLLLYRKKKLSSTELLLLLLSGGTLLAAGSNVLTGKETDFRTHPFIMSMPVYIIGIAILFRSFFSQKNRVNRTIVAICLGGLLLTTVNRTYKNAGRYLSPQKQEDIASRFSSNKDYEQVFDFFNEQKEKDKVILSQYNMVSYIPLYTPHYLLYTFHAGLHTIPEEEIFERVLIQYVNETDPEIIVQNAMKMFGYWTKFELAYRRLKDESVNAMDVIGNEKEFTQRALAKHADINRNYEEYLQKYGVDYIVTDSRAEKNPRVPSAASVAFKNDRFTVYRP